MKLKRSQMKFAKKFYNMNSGWMIFNKLKKQALLSKEIEKLKKLARWGSDERENKKSF